MSYLRYLRILSHFSTIPAHISSELKSKQQIVVSILSSANNPALRVLPTFASNVSALIGDQLDTFLKYPSFKDTEIVIVCSGVPLKLLHEIWPHLPRVRWLHSFLTGIDSIAPFLKSDFFQQNPSFPVTNGRSAFSISLAEYVLTVILYWTKQIPRLLSNKKEIKWERFSMSMVESKKIGFVGFGHIGQTTAELLHRCNLGATFIALHRTANKEGDDNKNKKNEQNEKKFPFI